MKLRFSKKKNLLKRIREKIRPGKKKVIKKDELRKDPIMEIFKELYKPAETNLRFAILGIGNDMKGDDGVGWYVIDKIKEELEKEKNLLLVKTSVPENHVREINEFVPKFLIIVDAADFKGRPGEIRIIKERNILKSFVSTHTTPVTVFLKLYRNQLSKEVAIIGIQKMRNEFGSSLSEPVRKSGDKLAKLISKLYRDNTLDLKLEKELKYMRNPLKRLAAYFRET